MFFYLLLLFCLAKQRNEEERSASFIYKTSSKSQNQNIKENSDIPIPISIPLTKTVVKGTKNCEITNICLDSITTEPCGERFLINEGNKDTSFEYTPKGLKAKNYGTNDPNQSPMATLSQFPVATATPIPEYISSTTAQATDKYANAAYINEHKIPASEFTGISSGDLNDHPLSYAFDENSRTFWTSSIISTNTSSTKGSITVTFNSMTCLEAILFDPTYATNRTTTPQTRRYDGFPIELKIYTSINNEEYKLKYIFSGQPTSADFWDRVQFVFQQPILCEKIKLEFTQVTFNYFFGKNYYASCSQLYFISSSVLVPTSTPNPTSTPDYESLTTVGVTGNYANDGYLSEHKVPMSSFTCNSPGDQSGHPITNAFDNNDKSFWVSSIVNTETVKSYLTFEFTNPTYLEAIVFGTAYLTNRSVTPNTRRYDGFPLVLKVFSSSNNEEYKLKYIFSCNPSPTDVWNRVQFVFSQPMWCDRIKLEFTEVTQDIVFGGDYTAAAAEIILVSPAIVIPSQSPMATLSQFPVATATPIPSPICDDFSKSDELTRSDFFTQSDELTRSDFFSKSDELTRSDFFSKSDELTRSDDFSKSNDFTISDDFSQSDFFPSNNFTRSLDFTESGIFSMSDEFSSSLIFSRSNTFINENQQNQAALTSLSVSFSVSYVSVKSVSFSLSYVASNTFLMSFHEDENTYYMLITQSFYISYFPYIIHYLSPVRVSTFISVLIAKKSKISPEQLIGVVCGSVSVFFLVLGIIIFALQKKYYVDNLSNDFSFDSSSAEITISKKANDTIEDFPDDDYI